MTWIALTDHDTRRLSLKGLGMDKQQAPLFADHPETQMRKGTLLFETRLTVESKPQVLLGYKEAYPEKRSLTFQAVPGGGIAMVQVQGSNICHAAIQNEEAGRTDVARVTYAWDVDANWARLTLERPEEFQLSTAYAEGPQPLTLQDVRLLMLGQGDHSYSPDMIFVALSDQVEPVGPMPTLVPSTPIATPWGYKAISDLKRGDTVITQNAGVVPVLQSINRMVPARGSYRPIRLRAPYFGLQDDIIVSPDQRLIIDGPEVEYLFNQEAVLVPARHLVNGFAAIEEPCGPIIRYTQLLLPSHETLITAGTAAESLYIGRLRRNGQELHNSMLGGFDRSTLPEHAKPAHQVLRWFDAIHLARQRAA